MKKLFILLFGIILILPQTRLDSQVLKKKNLPPIICYAGKKDHKMYIPPPKEFINKKQGKGGASITMVYSGFPSGAQAALDFAASILESVLPADTHLTIKAYWEEITTEGVLAQASTTSFVEGPDIDAWVPYAYYTVALADKIAGKTLSNEADGDIVFYVNSTARWYFGTDGNVPAYKYDLVTVALHEIIHGLGFFSSLYADASTGSYGISNIPLIFDTFVEDAAGKKLTDTLSYLNPSAALQTVLTSGHLYFNGPLLKNYSGDKAVLYAPSTFDPGSSVAHLDEDTYSTVNALMTPQIDMREAIHDPGKFTMSILGDLGWVNTRIIHTPAKDTEEHVTRIPITATIKSDTIYNHDFVMLFWSSDGSVHDDTIRMTSPQSDNNYTATIPVSSYETKIKYCFSVTDCFGRAYSLPSRIKDSFYSVYVGTDTIKPVIKHIQPNYFFEWLDTIGLKAVATDNIGVDTVFVEYKVNNGTLHHLELFSKGADVFGNTLDARTLILHDGDSIKYRIIAVDQANVPNYDTMPSTGWYGIRVEGLNPVASSYKTDFKTASGDFVNDGITILKPNGFSSYGLNTPHPYKSPEENGDSIEYAAILKTPLKFDQKGMVISYKEVALVEPGETGSVFGSSDFYDYVIVEGSKDFTKTWFPLCNGYDCRYYDAWSTAYNSSFDSTGQNSTFVPDEKLLAWHYIYPKTSSYFSTGDTLMIRFRLFSDPYANGWGWFIQDLNVEPLIDKVENPDYQTTVIYPNPGTGLITIKTDGDLGGKPFQYNIFNSAGILLSSKEFNGVNELNVNISDYPPGLYFIVLHCNDGIRTFRYVLVK